MEDTLNTQLQVLVDLENTSHATSSGFRKLLGVNETRLNLVNKFSGRSEKTEKPTKKNHHRRNGEETFKGRGGTEIVFMEEGWKTGVWVARKVGGRTR